MQGCLCTRAVLTLRSSLLMLMACSMLCAVCEAVVFSGTPTASESLLQNGQKSNARTRKS